MFLRDDALVLPVALVADENLVDTLGGVLLYVLEPGSDVCRARNAVSTGLLGSLGFPSRKETYC